MSAIAEAWQKAEIAGPKKAFVITKPKVVVAMVKKAKRPLIIVGHLAAETSLEYEKMLGYAIRLGKVGITVVATAHILNEFFLKKFYLVNSVSAMDIGMRLQDPSWAGLDGGGQYDLVLIMGLPYYLELMFLSGLKHFSPNLKTISLDRFYNPHASWSFPNLHVKAWSVDFETILKKLEGK